MEQQLTYNDLPQHVQQEMRQMINTSPAMQDMRAAHRMFVASGNYIQAINVAAKIKKVEDNIINQFLQKYQMERVQVNEYMSQMSDEDREEIIMYSNCVPMLADLIEVCVMEMNKIVQRYDSSTTIIQYDKLIAATREAGNALKFMYEITDYDYQKDFAYGAENMEKVFFNKARSLMKRNHNRAEYRESVRRKKNKEKDE